MDASAVAALVATLNAMTPAARQGVLASMAADARAQLLAGGLIDDAASSSAAVRDARLADIERLEAVRTSTLWTDATLCSMALEKALMTDGFSKCGEELSHWRAAFRGAQMALKRMDEAADSLASLGMPTSEADQEVVRVRRKALRKKIDNDLRMVGGLEKACDDLATLFRTLGIFQGGGGQPLRAAPSR
jgi:hypothetical protein